MRRASLIFHRKRVFDDGAISEMKIWLVREPVRGSPHSFKYSLFYGRPGMRLVGYDNEAGKGDHRHWPGQENAYTFLSPERLIADFLADVDQLKRGGH